MIRTRSTIKPKTKFQRLALLLPTLTPIKPFKKKEIKYKTVKGNKKKIGSSTQLRSSISQTVIVNLISAVKENAVPSSSLKTTSNLYKNIIEHNLINHNKNQEKNKQKKLNNITKLNIPRPAKQYKVDLNKQVKGMIPKIDDLEEFTNEIQRKHKGLFEKIIPLLFRQQQISFDQKKEFAIPLLLYEDYKYFINRFFPHKYAIKSMSFADSNMLYPSLIDYNSYIKKFKEYLSYFKQDNFTENAFNFDNAFYLKLLHRLTNDNKTKILSMTDKENENRDKDLLHEKYQKFMKVYNNTLRHNKSIDNNDIFENDSDNDNAIRSILKKKMNEEEKKIKSKFQLNEDYNKLTDDSKSYQTQHQNRYQEGKKDKENQNKQYNTDKENELNYSSSDKDEFLELHSKADSQMSNSYLDNSYIFQKNSNSKENQMKFSVRIMKNIQLDEKKVESLYDKYFGKINQKQFQRAYD